MRIYEPHLPIAADEDGDAAEPARPAASPPTPGAGAAGARVAGRGRSAPEGEHSPIRAQYLGVKRQYPDAVVFFRMGDFYETFDEDAELVARELEITLTRRDFGRGERSPMAGVPHHAAEGYIARLIGKGYRVAVCEQVSDPALSRGLVEREVLRVVTPGTVVDPAMLAAKRNNFLAAAVLGRDAVGIAYVDITTGEFATTQFRAADPEAALLQELARVQPAEVLVEARDASPRPLAARGKGERAAMEGATNVEDADDEDGGLVARLRELDARLSTVVTPYEARAFREDASRACLLDHFAVASLEGFGCQHLPLAIRAAGAVVAYLRATQRGALAQLTALETYSTSGFMALDTYTRRNLELFESGRGGAVKGSLLWVLDRTRTPMGGRLLRRWLGEPLLDLAALRGRQDAIAAALADVALRARLGPALARVGDLERLANRVIQRIATPRDLVALAAGLRAADEVVGPLPQPLPVATGRGAGAAAEGGSDSPASAPPADGPSPPVPTLPADGPSPPVPTLPADGPSPTVPTLPADGPSPTVPTLPADGPSPTVPTLPADGATRTMPTLSDSASPSVPMLPDGVPLTTLPDGVPPPLGTSPDNATPPSHRNGKGAGGLGLLAGPPDRAIVANPAPPAPTPPADNATPPSHRNGKGAGGLGPLAELIERAIVENPPLALSDGGVIRPGYSAELDHITTAARDARQWVANLERTERERTGIPNLKVGYNKVFGYYLEVTNSHAGKVPADYIRKQTLTTGERFITPDLKEYEALILNAHEKSVRLEQELFAELRAEIATRHADRILRTARTLAEMDVILSLAEVAERQGYCRPELDESDGIHVVAGRHPVVELSQGDAPFVPNDIELSTHDAQILLLTGPNMAGKSTYLRQVALIVLLAQIGSYVPAEAARIGLVDRIFTRIGAQDDLATGQSTFMVEMVETASILHHATPRSLVVLDEIGRGTSTYDGLAIARAIVEYLHNNKRCGARTLFATHYHELVELGRTLPRVRPYNVAVAEEDGHIAFLRKIVPGGADKSYGIHVAQLAGIPRQVVRRAEEVLEELERKGDAHTRRRVMRDLPVAAAVQLTLFSAEPDPLVEELKALPIDELTPLEALTRLYELQRRARERG